MASTRREEGDVPNREDRPAIHFDRVLATHEGVIDIAQSIAIGEVTFDDGRFTGALPGTLVRGGREAVILEKAA